MRLNPLEVKLPSHPKNSSDVVDHGFVRFGFPLTLQHIDSPLAIRVYDYLAV